MRTTFRQTVAAAVSAAMVAGLPACGFTGAQDLPLPGGAALGSRPYQVTAQFSDVLDLVPHAHVKVNHVPVGSVSEVRLAGDGKTAEVIMDINGDVRLPRNASAQLQQSSLLGEKYVQLDAPEGAGGGRLTSGAYIPIGRTGRSPQVEEVLGALSMLLNGGGVGQLQTITRELNAAMSGRESDIRQLFSTLETTTRQLDAQKGDITHALDGLNRLSVPLSRERDNIATTLDHTGPGLAVINQQREQLVTMLQSLNKLSQVSVDTVNRSREDLVANLHALNPTLQKLAEAGDRLPKSLEILATFPFTDHSLNVIKGDYANADFKLDLDLSSVLDNLKPPPPQGGQPGTAAPPPLPLGTLPPGTLPPGAPIPAPDPGGVLLDGLLGGA